MPVAMETSFTVQVHAGSWYRNRGLDELHVYMYTVYTVTFGLM